jgi:serine/threonine protein kinase
MLQRLLLLRDVAAGMEFLHSKNIVHSDLVSALVM